MDFYNFKTGSFGKGYGIEGLSDDDRCVITRASKDFYKNIILNKSKNLTNINIISGLHDTKYMDILNVFIELINGKGATILIFGLDNPVINKNIINFSREVAEYNKKTICENMLKFNINKKFDTNVKKVLSLLFNLSLVDKWLESDEFPSEKFPEILKVDKKDLFNQLMVKRTSECEATLDETEIIENYRSELLNKVDKLDRPKKLEGMGAVIYDFLINDVELYIPNQQLDDSIMEIKYPSLLSLITDPNDKNSLLKNKILTIQEKINGVHFRIVYNDGNVFFGNKEKCLEDEYFYNYESIAEELIKGIKQVYSFIKQKKIIIYGTLCGNYYNRIISDFIPIVKGVKIFDNKEKMQFYAHDIKIFDDRRQVYDFINFETSQIILKDAGFEIIPYEKKNHEEFFEHKSDLLDDKKEKNIMEYVIRYDNNINKVKKFF